MSKTGGRRILIVEDEWLIAETMAQTLRDYGYEIVGPVASVESACRAIEHSPPDAALLDVSLGAGETSYPVARRLASSGVRFAFLTGYAQLNLPGEFRGSTLLSKPVPSDALERVIAELVGER